MISSKSIAVRISLIAIIIIVGNEIYKAYWWHQDMNKFNPTLDNLWANEPNADILYFGESSNFHLERPGAVKVRISDYLDEMLVNQKVNHVDNAGLDASNYLALMRHIPQNSKVHTLIVTMNLRSFGYDWILGGNYNFTNRSNEFIKQRMPLLNRFFIALKTYPNLSNKERDALLKNHKVNDLIQFPFAFNWNTIGAWNNHIKNGFWLKQDGNWDMAKIELGSHFIKNFAFQIDPKTNPRIQDFDEIVQFAKNRNLHLVFHILSENLEQAEDCVGKELVLLLKHNAQFLVDRYSKNENVTIVNNLETVPNAMFVDRHFPTEHYTDLGKKMCARNLANSIARTQK